MSFISLCRLCNCFKTNPQALNALKNERNGLQTRGCPWHLASYAELWICLCFETNVQKCSGHAVFKVSYACMYIMCNPTTHPTYTYQITVDYDCTFMYIFDSLLSEIVITYIHYLSTVIQDKLLLNLEHIKTLNLTLVAPHCLFIKEVYQRLHFVFLPVTFIIINITPFTLRRTNKKVVIRCHYISIFQLRMTNF